MNDQNFKILKNFLKETLGRYFDLNKDHVINLKNGDSCRKGYKRDLSGYNVFIIKIENIVQIKRYDNFQVGEKNIPIYIITVMIYSTYFNIEGNHCHTFIYHMTHDGEILTRSDFFNKYAN